MEVNGTRKIDTQYNLIYIFYPIARETEEEKEERKKDHITKSGQAVNGGRKIERGDKRHEVCDKGIKEIKAAD